MGHKPPAFGSSASKRREVAVMLDVSNAARLHLITNEMAIWAHEVRLDANDVRHADENAPLPDVNDAKKCVEFTKAIAMFLFGLPSMVERGRGK